MKSVTMFNGIIQPIPENYGDMQKVLNTNPIIARNQPFCIEMTRELYQGYRKPYTFHILFQFMRYGNTGAFQACWEYGDNVTPILKVRWDFNKDKMNGDKSERYLDVESIFDHALCGTIDFIQTVLLRNPLVPVRNRNIQFKFHLDKALKTRVSKTVSFVKNPKRWKCMDPNLFGVHALLWDQKEDTKFDLIQLEFSRVWNTEAIYRMREETGEIAKGISGYEYDYLVTDLDQMLCTRKLGEYRSLKSLEIGSNFYKWKSAYETSVKFGPY